MLPTLQIKVRVTAPKSAFPVKLSDFSLAAVGKVGSPPIVTALPRAISAPVPARTLVLLIVSVPIPSGPLVNVPLVGVELPFTTMTPAPLMAFNVQPPL